MGTLRKAQKYLDDILVGTACALLFALMFGLTADALSRDLLNNPFPGMVSISTFYMMPAISFLAIGYVQAHRGHVYVELLQRLLPLKVRLVLELLMWTVALALFVIVMWQGILSVSESLRIRELDYGVIRLPIWLGRMTLPLGALAMCLALILDIAVAAKRTYDSFRLGDDTARPALEESGGDS